MQVYWGFGLPLFFKVFVIPRVSGGNASRLVLSAAHSSSELMEEPQGTGNRLHVCLDGTLKRRCAGVSLNI